MVDIVGRIPQRAQLSRWLIAAISGQPAVVVVDGPPGVGKSTLVSWLVAEAQAAGATTRVVVVPERGDAADDLGTAIVETDEQMRRSVPQLLVIDDAHWLDDAGQHLVEHLAFRLGTAAVTGQPARVCLLLVARPEPSRLMSHLVDEPITRRMSLSTLDDREARELARQITPGITDRRTLARLAELSGGNPLTLSALADSIALGEVLPSPASTTGTIPVEVAWRARLATLSTDALRAAVLIALAEQAVQSRGTDGVDVLAGADAAVDELQAMGAIQRRAGAVSFTHPLLRTTALDLASPALVAEVAGQLLDQLDVVGGSTAAGTLVRLSDAAHRTGDEHHRDLVQRAYDEAIEHASWSAAGDLAEYLVETATDTPDRAHWTHRLGTARFNELDRDEATKRLIEAADMYEGCLDGASAEAAAEYRDGRAEALLLALRTDFTRGGPRRHAELDEMVGTLVVDASISALWRARAAAILVEAIYAIPQHDRRRQLIEQAETLAVGVDDSLTVMMVGFARGWHALATLDLVSATDSFTAADQAALDQPDPWWQAGSLARRAMVGLVADRSLVAVADATASIERSSRTSNWAEHGVALAARSIANTRIGRFVDADNDTESMILSARRAADAVDPFLMSISTARCGGGQLEVMSRVSMRWSRSLTITNYTFRSLS